MVKGDVFDDFGVYVGCEFVVGDVGLDEFWCDGVDVDIVVVEFVGYGFGKVKYVCFGSVVVGVVEDVVVVLCRY